MHARVKVAAHEKAERIGDAIREFKCSGDNMFRRDLKRPNSIKRFPIVSQRGQENETLGHPDNTTHSSYVRPIDLAPHKLLDILSGYTRLREVVGREQHVGLRDGKRKIGPYVTLSSVCREDQCIRWAAVMGTCRVPVAQSMFDCVLRQSVGRGVSSRYRH